MTIRHRFLGLALVVTASAILQGCDDGKDSSRPEVFRRIEAIEARVRKLDAQVQALQTRTVELQGRLPISVEKAGTVITNTIGMKLALIPAGEFVMGSPDSDDLALNDEKPRHRVRIAHPFYLGIHEVTESEWAGMMESTPRKDRIPLRLFKEGDRYPATHVSWDDATEFCRKLTERERHAGRLGAGESYRLPTEAEWEYACRAGTTTRYQFGDGEDSLGEYAWYAANAEDVGEKYPHAVGRKRANAWGLFDMHGNVWEWCGDWYGKEYYGESPGTDPQGSSKGSDRVRRGGSWLHSASYCPSALRLRRAPSDRQRFLGFRVARSSDPST